MPSWCCSTWATSLAWPRVSRAGRSERCESIEPWGPWPGGEMMRNWHSFGSSDSSLVILFCGSASLCKPANWSGFTWFSLVVYVVWTRGQIQTRYSHLESFVDQDLFHTIPIIFYNLYYVLSIYWSCSSMKKYIYTRKDSVRFGSVRFLIARNRFGSVPYAIKTA